MMKAGLSQTVFTRVSLVICLMDSANLEQNTNVLPWRNGHVTVKEVGGCPTYASGQDVIT